MRLYVAGSTKGIAAVRVVMDLCLRGGHEITFDWTGDDGEVRQNQGDWARSPNRANEIAATEREGVATADALVLVAPPDGTAGLGCWIEVGMAIGRGIPIVLVGDTLRESVFWHLPNIRRSNIPSLLLILAELEARTESVLAEAERLVNGARSDSYGHPAEHSSRVAGAWRSVFGWDVDAFRVNLAMVIFKTARADVGRGRDSLVDIGGWSRTAEATLAREGAQGFQDLGPR